MQGEAKVMSEKEVRIGFVGCGGIAQAHMDALSKIEGVKLVAFCDIVPEKAKASAKKFGGKAFTKVKQMIKSVELDALYFCLPPFAHGDELLAIEYGIPFFVEKPVGLNLGLIKEIAYGVREKNLLTSVGYMNRYRRSVNTVRELLQKDSPILLIGGWIGGTPLSLSGIWHWWVQKDKSGGQFHEQVTHTVDLARYLAGEVVEVHAFQSKGLNRLAPEHYTVEDAMVVNLKFQSEAIANLWACCAANGGGGGVSLQVYANETTAHFSGWEHNVRIYRRNEDILEIRGEGDIFRIEDEAFVKALKTGDRSFIRSDYIDGAKTAVVTLAAVKSAETGKPVEVEQI